MADQSFKLEIVTPSRVVYLGDVLSFSAPGVMGGFQILYNHAPMVAEIGVGELKLQQPNGTELIYSTSGGFVDVLKNHVIVLAETVERSDEIDTSRAETARDHARQKLSGRLSEKDISETKAALDRAISRIKVAGKK